MFIRHTNSNIFINIVKKTRIKFNDKHYLQSSQIMFSFCYIRDYWTTVI